MAFEGLSTKLQAAMKKLRGKGKLSEKDIKDAMREVKLALLEADVNYKIVKNFVKVVGEKCLGNEVMESLTPGQQVIKIVNEELTNLMGKEESKIEFEENGITVIMAVGLQGAGKTTMCGKLSLSLKKKNKKPLLVACDIYRPAAIKQLEVVGKSIDVPVFSMGDKVNPVDISKAAMKHAKENGLNVVIIDTAGRLHIDDQLMNELENIKSEVNPKEILLVVDSMTGQDAVNVAESFDNKLELTGVVLTKLDGDTRGGAALSIREMTGKPIKYVGLGEKMNDIEIFHPDRMASRILGMGDVLTLIEKAQSAIDEKQAKELGDRMLSQEFNFDDFLQAFEQMKKLGPIGKLLEMVPGFNSSMLKGVDLSKNEGEMKKYEAIIKSMTAKERKNPSLITSTASRKRRIALGSGTTVQEVNKILKNFEQMKKMMKQFKGNKFSKKGLFGGKMPF
ncbi:signal recognition particle subunit SRP54 [Clostridium acetobutylicum]|uniref:Signal recognition particle protein n=1 Tax=Clostridium acetobutylicum (strain ATCC 824 / DSM 792 / JCM 1419 / IAM 19013 / LMG 5710 / NBRC 13948 / NRRL B-527 / VKM B-1787 / 2291 / W) TaxID=272562 RepID=Q97I98_CLOAB|nr:MULTISPECIES: signal recognition particle protein [Clostridium]AAK79720.1 Signal recognition particle GTPase Ffh [Clostridium acetobutylicum ATCC 824]ADZ20804.1 Signal recognition particle GTPase Ffh [Clostridium acetobutylicum EA 2018]AEI34266.1 Signal recognition particle GTPase Ffh [Clostridium acetobutylicum DSM 1731]AWV79845.1 signal recognition particle protein [Clostridium acetobutylicum]MBC2394171.1 signal recognition particle protein [Clostridium acetobutylicum]